MSLLSRLFKWRPARKIKLELPRGPLTLYAGGGGFAFRRDGELLAFSSSFSSLDVSYQDGRVIGLVECHGRRR